MGHNSVQVCCGYVYRRSVFSYFSSSSLTFVHGYSADLARARRHRSVLCRVQHRGAQTDRSILERMVSKPYDSRMRV
jgi:hypothetical protein